VSDQPRSPRPPRAAARPDGDPAATSALDRALLTDLLDLLPVGIHAKDPRDGLRYVLWNQAMEAITGLPAGEVLGRTDADIFPAEVARHHVADDEAAMREGRPLRRDGTVSQYSAPGHVMNVRKLPLRGADGEVALVVTLVEDVTEQRRLERQVQHAQKMEAVSRLAGGIAHDFNNLLQVIMGYGELLRSDLPAGRDRADLERILKAGAQAGTLVGQLLSFSRQDRPQRTAPVDLGALVDRMQQVLRRVIGEDIALECTLHPEAPLVLADAAQLEQMLLDLCVNARDAMPDGGTLTLRTLRSEVDAAASLRQPELAPGLYGGFSVTDTGVGIPPDLQATIFEPFFTTKEVGSGSGLGLASAYAVARAHGGAVEVQSRPGRGATFTVRIPAAPAHVVERTGAETRAAAAVAANTAAALAVTRAALGANGAAGATPAATGLILVAEDQDAVRDLCTTILERAGYTVVTARDGAEAVELYAAATRPFDLLLLDVRMPGLDGAGALAAIRARGGTAPVLFCSGYQDEEIPPELLAEAAGELLRKPYAADELLARVAAALGRAEMA